MIYVSRPSRDKMPTKMCSGVAAMDIEPKGHSEAKSHTYNTGMPAVSPASSAITDTSETNKGGKAGGGPLRHLFGRLASPAIMEPMDSAGRGPEAAQAEKAQAEASKAEDPKAEVAAAEEQKSDDDINTTLVLAGVAAEEAEAEEAEASECSTYCTDEEEKWLSLPLHVKIRQELAAEQMSALRGSQRFKRKFEGVEQRTKRKSALLGPEDDLVTCMTCVILREWRHGGVCAACARPDPTGERVWEEQTQAILTFEMRELSDISEDDEDGKERRRILMERRRQALDKPAGSVRALA